MSDFFEPPPPPPEPQREHRQPEWLGPPDDVVGIVVPLDLTLARTDDVALILRGATVYPAGVQFDLPLFLRKTAQDPFGFMRFHPGARGEETFDDVLRLGIQFADGAKVSSTENPFMLANLDGQPAGPVLVPRSGGGGEHRWEVLFWMWPLPKEDPFRIVVEWPSRGIDLSLVDVPVAPLVEAASRCEELWPAGEGHDGRVSDFT